MELMENSRYLMLLDKMDQVFPDWNLLYGKSFFISGASGMIGSFLVDAIMRQNTMLPPDKQCRVIAMGRNQAAAEHRFKRWSGMPAFQFLAHDVTQPLPNLSWEPDYWIHAASNTDPISYSGEPINTILANVLGTLHLLDRASKNQGSRFLLLSSVEIYGENRGDVELFQEGYCGYIDSNTLRASYPEAKRVSEALCQAYIAQKGVDAVILRLPRCYGPTMRSSDAKAVAQFLRKAAAGEDIVLMSAGTQHNSYAHVFDAVTGILRVLLSGERGQAYNLSDEKSDVTLRQLAEIAARYGGTSVQFAPREQWVQKEYSTKALMDGSKLKKLGWKAQYDITRGVCETIDILRQLREA